MRVQVDRAFAVYALGLLGFPSLPEGSGMAADIALYHPYIRVRDENWLKGILLLFESVERMVRVNWVQDDGPWVCGYIGGRRKTLLGHARISSEPAHRAQQGLAERLERDADTLLCSVNSRVRSTDLHSLSSDG